MDDTKELQESAMQIILHAGDARTIAVDALAAAREGDFGAAEAGLVRAVDKINEAHRAHTDIIAREAEGHQFPYSILFAHAQDTMMTIDSEIRTYRQLVDIIKMMGER